jgi:hypothetical protein
MANVAQFVGVEPAVVAVAGEANQALHPLLEAIHLSAKYGAVRTFDKLDTATLVYAEHRAISIRCSV